MENNVLPYDRDELCKAYTIAGSIKELAKQYTLPKWFVSYELVTANIIGGDKYELSENWSLVTLMIIRNGMRKYKSIKELAKNLGITPYALRKSLLEHGIFQEAWVRAKPYQWIEADLKKDFETYGTIKEIAKKYHCHRETLLKALRKFGLIFSEEKKSENRTQYHFTTEQLTDDYNELQSLTAIANKYGCSLYTIWKYCNKLGVVYPKMRQK